MGGIAIEEVKQWADAQIQSWLASHRLAHHAQTFAKNDITGNVLLDVDQNALKEMGITAIGDRIRIFSAIKTLKKRCIETAQTNRSALLRAQERAEQAHQARLHAEQVREDAQLLADLTRPHAAEYDGLPSPSTGSESAPSSAGWRFTNTPSATAANTTLSANGLNGFSTGSASAGGARKGHHSRPPPLRLSGSATSNVSGTPSPSSIAAFSHGQGLGLSQARGLMPGSRHTPNPANQGRTNAVAAAKAGSPAIGSDVAGQSTSGTASPPITLSHRKTNSAVGAASFLQRNPTSASQIAQRQFGSYAGQGASSSRPSTATGGAPASTTPYNYPPAKLASPTNPTFSRSAGRPSTADTSYDQLHRQSPFATGSSSGSGGIPASSSTGSMPSDGSVPLTPITEGNNYSPTTPSASNTHFGNARSVRGGSIAGGSTSTPGGPAPPSLEDLKRRTIKFIGADGTTRIVNVSDCRDAHDVLARVLKKFGKNPASNSYPPTLGQNVQGSQGDGTNAGASGTADSTAGTSDVEKYVIVATSGEGATRDLKPEELLAICHAPQPYDPLRERGLTLRRISPNAANMSNSGDSTSRRIARSGRHKLEAFFGERSFNDGGSSNNNGPASPAPSNAAGGPTFLVEDPSSNAYAGQVTTAGKKMNRASTVSIMSGLGVSAALGVLSGGIRDSKNDSTDSNDYYYQSPKPQSQHQQQLQAPRADRSSNSDAKSNRTSLFPRKARNFMGQRPPSELISSHLADYFPATEKKVLERTARKSIYGRASSSTRSSKRDSTWSFNALAERDEVPPPLPNKTSLDVGRPEDPGRVDTSAPMLPPVVGRTSLDEWSKSLQTVGARPEPTSSNAYRGARLEIPDGSQRPMLGSANSASASSPGGTSVSSGSYNQHSSLGGMGGASPAPSYSSARPRNNRQGSSNTTSRASIDSGRSRKSYASQLRAARGIGSTSKRGSSNLDRSDAASMLTVDEITQEVESRRESMSILGLSPSEEDEEEEHIKDDVDGDEGDAKGWVVDEDGVPIPVGPQMRGGGEGASSRRARRRTGNATRSVIGRKKKRRFGDVTEAAALSAPAAEATTPTTATTFSDTKPPSLHRSAPSDEADGAEGDGEEDEEEEEEEEEEEDVYDDSIFHVDSDERGSEEDELSSDYDSSDESDGEIRSAVRSPGLGPGTGASSAGASGGIVSSTTKGSAVATPASGNRSASSAGKQPIKWIKGALIGAGSFGSVVLGMNAKNGLLMAVKQVELPSGQSQNDQKKKRMLDALEGEIELLKTLQHDNIVQYLDSYADGEHLNIFLEYVPGGSVVALLRNYGAFEEPLVRNFVRQILQGLSFLHNKGIVHRDIKGANILVDNKSCIKISDFGISKKVESDLLANARAHRPSLQGSVFWMAPEVVKQTSYTRKADIWSLGCLVVEMMSGTHPWPNLNQMQALFKIGSSARPSIPDEISAEAVDFLNLTFELDHEARPNADELLAHKFITEDVGGLMQVGEVSEEDEVGESQDATIEANASTVVDASDPRTPTRATSSTSGGAVTTPTEKAGGAE